MIIIVHCGGGEGDLFYILVGFEIEFLKLVDEVYEGVYLLDIFMRLKFETLVENFPYLMILLY